MRKMSDLDKIDEQPSDAEELSENDRRRALLYLRQEGVNPDAFQRRSLRWIVIAFSALLIFSFGCLEYYVLWCLTDTDFSSNGLFVVLCVAPIVAATTIVVFMLIGVFRGFRGTDLSSLPLETVGKAAFGNDA